VTIYWVTKVGFYLFANAFTMSAVDIFPESTFWTFSIEEWSSFLFVMVEKVPLFKSWCFWSWLLQHIQRFVHQKGTPLQSFFRFFLLIMYRCHFFIFRTYKLKESIIFLNKMVPSFYRVLFFLFPSYLLCNRRKCI